MLNVGSCVAEAERRHERAILSIECDIAVTAADEADPPYVGLLRQRPAPPQHNIVMPLADNQRHSTITAQTPANAQG
jgi:hypothetical protein